MKKMTSFFVKLNQFAKKYKFDGWLIESPEGELLFTQNGYHWNVREFVRKRMKNRWEELQYELDVLVHFRLPERKK